MLVEQAAQLPAADPQSLGEGFDTRFALVERAFGDQFHRPAHRVGRAAPEGELRRALWAAAKAGPEACFLGGGCRGKVATVLEFGRACGADRPAVDAGRGNTHEDAAVETRVVALEDLVTGLAIHDFFRHFHGFDTSMRSGGTLAVFGHQWCLRHSSLRSAPKRWPCRGAYVWCINNGGPHGRYQHTEAGSHRHSILGSQTR